MKIVNTQRAITPKVEKPELRFMCSARRLIVFNVCEKFHENMSSGVKVMEWTQKLLTHKRQELQVIVIDLFNETVWFNHRGGRSPPRRLNRQSS